MVYFIKKLYAHFLTNVKFFGGGATGSFHQKLEQTHRITMVMRRQLICVF
jgi:hypothetical protein